MSSAIVLSWSASPPKRILPDSIGRCPHPPGCAHRRGRLPRAARTCAEHRLSIAGVSDD